MGRLSKIFGFGKSQDAPKQAPAAKDDPRSAIPVDVCSYRRSGTHVLMATIAENFELPDLTINEIVRAGRKFVTMDGKEWPVGTRAPIPWRNLFRTHNYYNPKAIENPAKILYIVRNPVDTLLSNWRFYDPSAEFDKAKFIGEGAVKVWLKHATGYTKNCHWIKYEDLIGRKHKEVLDQIAEWFDLKPKAGGYKKIEKRIGWYPAKFPTQSRQAPMELIKQVKATVPDGFLGYKIRG